MRWAFRSSSLARFTTYLGFSSVSSAATGALAPCTVQKIACLFTHVSCQCAESGAHLRRRSSSLFGTVFRNACCSQKKDHQEPVTHKSLSNIYYDPLLGHGDWVCSDVVCFSPSKVVHVVCSNPSVSLDSFCVHKKNLSLRLILDARRSCQHSGYLQNSPWQLGDSNFSLGIRMEGKHLRFTSLLVMFKMQFHHMGILEWFRQIFA